MDGFALAEQIRQNPDLTCVPIMMLTSGGHADDIARCRALGISDYLLKPITQSNLFACIMTRLGGVLEQQGPCRQSPGANDAFVRPLKVLLVEDNAVNQMVAVRLLEKRGHQVVVANNGQEALHLLGVNAPDVSRQTECGETGHSFDAILMDVQMPIMGGFEATAALRMWEKQTGGHTPVIAMTAHAMKGDRDRCAQASMDGYVSKPVRADELYEMLESLAVPRTSVHSQPADAVANDSAPDWAAALKAVGGDGALLRDIVGIVLQEVPCWLRELEAHISCRRGEDVRRLAHTIKGALGQLAAARACAAAQRLESLPINGDLSSVGESFSRLQQSWTELQPLLVQFLASFPT
jgi:CheY-like chemotaxis protein